MLDQKPIGEIVLKNIDLKHSSCEMGISMINDSYKNKGYGTAAERLILEYAFRELEMQTVFADALIGNQRSQRVLAKVGFIKPIRMINLYITDGIVQNDSKSLFFRLLYHKFTSNATKFLFCCVRFVYTYLTIQVCYRGPDPAPSFVQGVQVYSYMRYGAFVALDILEVCFMRFLSVFRLFRECYNIAGSTGLIACIKYLCGRLQLDQIAVKSSDFSGGVIYE